MAQVIEHLPSKSEALGSNLRTTKTKQTKKHKNNWAGGITHLLLISPQNLLLCHSSNESVCGLVLTLGSVSVPGVSTGWVMSEEGSMGGTRQEVKLGWGRWAGLRLIFCTCGEASG
jgi:hypothetical protein